MIDELLLANNLVKLLESFDLYTREPDKKYVTVQRFRDIIVPAIIEKSKVKDSDDMALVCLDYISNYCESTSCGACTLINKKGFCYEGD